MSEQRAMSLLGVWPSKYFENIYSVIQLLLKIYHVPSICGEEKRLVGRSQLRLINFCL